MSKYRKLSHVVYRCDYHIVFAPKYRFRILTGAVAELVDRDIRMLAEWRGAGAQALASGSTFEFQSDRGNEPRWIAVGTHPATQKVIAVVYTIREGRYRIVSVRRARKNEDEDYRKRVERAAAEAEERGEARPDEEH
jgi:uncharacterized DUF497 family protein